MNKNTGQKMNIGESKGQTTSVHMLGYGNLFIRESLVINAIVEPIIYKE